MGRIGEHPISNVDSESDGLRSRRESNACDFGHPAMLSAVVPVCADAIQAMPRALIRTRHPRSTGFDGDSAHRPVSASLELPKTVQP